MKKLLFLVLFFGVSNISSMNKVQKARTAVRLLGAYRGTQSRDFMAWADPLKPVVVVRERENAVVEKFGKFDRVMLPGLHFKVPLIENIRRSFDGNNRVDLRECVDEMPTQHVITKDNVVMEISGLVYYRVDNAHDAVYGIDDLSNAINKLAQTTLRNLVGGLHLDETLTSRDQINTRLREELDDAADKWGVTVTRVELQEVNPPHNVREAMEREMTSERNRRALILEAEGKKKAATLEAEGIANAKVAVAEAEAKSLDLINRALAEDPSSSSYLLALKYLDTLPKMTEGKAGKTVVVPYDAASLAGMMSMIKDLVTK